VIHPKKKYSAFEVTAGGIKAAEAVAKSWRDELIAPANKSQQS
jgi:hypothetical protein